MQSNGGLSPLSQLARRSAYIVRSGPAAGVIAAGGLAKEAGFDKIITADMGGTSFDVAVVIDSEPRVAEKTDLDFRVPLRLPMIDVHTIGAGGGSIASVDRGGILEVGPRSAGSVLDELGVRGYEVNTWFGFIAPAGTPGEIVARLNSEMNRIFALPDVKENLASQGFELASPMAPPEFMKLIRDDMAKWIPIVKASGATVN